MKVVLVCFFSFFFLVLSGQSEHSQLRMGDLHYERQDWMNAEDAYRKAWVNKNNLKGGYNLGNAIYQQKRYEEAIRQYEILAQQAETEDLRQKAYHNLGNAHYQAQQFDKSIDAYKSALKLNPEDQDTKKNLLMAQQQLKLQQQQQEQQKPQQKQPKDQDKKEQSPSPQDQQDQPTQSDPKDQNQEQEQKTAMTKEQAEQLLQVINQEEQRVQQKLRKATSKSSKPLKEW